MSNCIYTLHLNDESIKFYSEEELNTFLQKYYDVLSSGEPLSDFVASKVVSNGVFKDSELTYYKLVKAAENLETMSYKINAGGVKEETEYKAGLRSITRIIKELAEKEPNTGLLYFSEDNYRKNRLDDLLALLDNDLALKTPDQEKLALLKKDLDYKLKKLEITKKEYDKAIIEPLMASIKKDMDNWAKLAKFGTDLHAVSEQFFKMKANNVLNKTNFIFTVDDFPTTVVGLTDETKISYINYLENLYASLESYHDGEIIVMPEYRMVDEKAKAIGVIDLLVIDKKGRAHIYDFKTSYKEPGKWHSAKRLTYFFQLGAYRNMLRNKGVKVDTIAVVPLQLNDINYDENTVKSLSFYPADELRHSEFVLKEARIERIIPTLEGSGFESTGKAKEVEEFLKEGFDYNLSFKSTLVNVDKFMEKCKPGDVPGTMKFYDRTVMREIVVPEADLRKTVEEYFKRDAENTLSSFYNAKNEFTKIVDGTLDISNMSIFKEKTVAMETKSLIRRAFMRYTMGGWNLVQDNPDLDQLGILMFVNVLPDGKKIVEFVSFTSNELDAELTLNGRHTLLGKYVDDSLREKYPNLLSSTNGNIELMKILAYISHNKKKFDEGNYTIGRLAVYNEFKLDFHTEDVGKLIYNFDFLTGRMNKPNKLVDLKRASTYDLLLGIFNSVRGEDGLEKFMPNYIDSMTSALMDRANTDKLAVLNDLERQTRKLLIERKMVETLNNFDHPLKVLYGRISEAIVQEKKYHVSAERDMTEFVQLFGSPGTTTSEAANFIHTIMERAMQKLRDRQLAFRHEVGKVANDFLDAQGYSVARRNTIGDTSSAYNNMFVKEPSTGEVHSNLILKNPYDSNSALTDNERKYLKFFLAKINKERFGSEDPNSDIGKVKIASGEWFHLPLMRSHTFNKMFKRDIKRRVKDYLDTLIDPSELFTTEKDPYNKAIQEGMYEMVNNFDSQESPEGRDRLLHSENMGAFESDLEVILDFYMFNKFRKQEYDKILPEVIAVKTALAMQSYEANIDIPTTLKYIENQTRNVLYSNPFIKKENQQIMKFAQGVKDTATYMNMALNPISGITNFMTGMWGNLSRLMARTYGKDMFTYSEFMSAFRFVTKDTTSSVVQYTLLEELNMRYGLNNIDMNRLPERLMTNRAGMLSFKSTGLFWFMTAPDYFNRMVLLIAQMKHDGCFEAHSMVDGVLVYDFKKDKRFSAYLSQNKADPKYADQKALYLAMLEDFNKEGENLKEGDPLPHAYNNRQRNSLKAFADSIHGHYDHATKVQANYTVLGTLFMQFKNWLVAKKNQYFLKGKNGEPLIGLEGGYVQMEVDGVLYYRDKEGNLTTENTGDIVKIWQGRPMEGIFISFAKMFIELRESENKLNTLGEMIIDPFRSNPNRPTRASNMRLFAADMAIVILFLSLFGFVDWGEMKQEDPFTYSVSRAFYRSVRDVNPAASIGSMISSEPIASVAYFKDVYDSFWKLVSGDEKIGNFIMANTGMLRAVEAPVMNMLGQ